MNTMIKTWTKNLRMCFMCFDLEYKYNTYFIIHQIYFVKTLWKEIHYSLLVDTRNFEFVRRRFLFSIRMQNKMFHDQILRFLKYHSYHRCRTKSPRPRSTGSVIRFWGKTKNPRWNTEGLKKQPTKLSNVLLYPFDSIVDDVHQHINVHVIIRL